MKDHQIAELINRITKEIQPLCPEHESLRTRVSSAANKYLDEIDHDSVGLEDESVTQTFGGESFIDGWEFAEYGIDFGEVSVYNISPVQMVDLALKMVDHLILNGHRFEIQKTGEQDQCTRLVYLNPTAN
jgi:hypothetical protein